ncbi:MAG TPA: Dyp-type peroxidase [Solirubrobacteraceae bacterium]|nr:Dyp-type peroxidase [Solirubrobacteraceae bacterium]
MTPKEVAHRVLERLVAQRDPTIVAQLVAADAAASMLAQAYERLALTGALEAPRWSVRAAVSEGDRVVVHSTLTGHSRGVADAPGAGELTDVAMLDELVVRDDLVRYARLRTLGPRPADPLSAPVAEPVLELAEIQGAIIPGLNKDRQALLFLNAVDLSRARRQLGELAASLATAEEVLSFNRLFSAARSRRGFEGTVRATWTNLALSHAFLLRLSPDAEAFADVAFREGMAARAALLGDAPAGATAADGNCWLPGERSRSVDALVIVASDDDDDLEDEVRRLIAQLDGFDVIHRDDGSALGPPLTGHEPFGFADGISQPGLRGRSSQLPDDFLTPRRNPDDPRQGMPGQRLVWPGEFVFGYPEQDPVYALRPGAVASGGPPWATNGSLLVFRRFEQDRERFDAFLRTTAAALAAKRPEIESLTPEAVGAKLVGRWRSGAPLARVPAADDPDLARDDCAVNNFGFCFPTPAIAGGRQGCSDDRVAPAPADPDGVRCPHAAHIRKAYPRDDVGPEVQRHRLLRRGIPLARAGERVPGGLLFLAYQTSIERQFEFVLRRWVNSPTFAAPDAGHDPIVGLAGGGPLRFGLPVRRADGSVATVEIDLPGDWTTVTGGGYFFAPSIGGLLALAR